MRGKIHPLQRNIQIMVAGVFDVVGVILNMLTEIELLCLRVNSFVNFFFLAYTSLCACYLSFEIRLLSCESEKIIFLAINPSWIMD